MFAPHVLQDAFLIGDVRDMSGAIVLWLFALEVS